MAEKIEVKHANIYAALAAFQGENPDIKKTKRFGKVTDTMTFMYAELGNMISVISPLTSKHALAYTWESAGEGKIQCVLYHETSKHVRVLMKETHQKLVDGTDLFEENAEMQWDNVIRSAPITVARSGKMQTIGSDSTYARKYTLCEVLGITSDEDTDAPISEESAKNAVKTVFTSFKEKMKNGDKAYVVTTSQLIEKELALIGAKKAPKLGLTKEQYQELWQMAEDRMAELNDTQETGKEDKSVNVD